MPFLLLSLFLLPFLEIYLLVAVGGVLGVVPTIALVLGLSMFGAYLLRQQGLAALFTAQDALAHGRLPVAAIYDSLGLTVAGALIVTPGFITDAVGFALLVPPVRRWATTSVLRWLLLEHLFQSPQPQPAKPAKSAPAGGPVIEGEYRRIDD